MLPFRRLARRVVGGAVCGVAQVEVDAVAHRAHQRAAAEVVVLCDSPTDGVALAVGVGNATQRSAGKKIAERNRSAVGIDKVRLALARERVRDDRRGTRSDLLRFLDRASQRVVAPSAVCVIGGVGGDVVVGRGKHATEAVVTERLFGGADGPRRRVTHRDADHAARVARVVGGQTFRKTQVVTPSANRIVRVRNDMVLSELTTSPLPPGVVLLGSPLEYLDKSCHPRSLHWGPHHGEAAHPAQVVFLRS